MMSFRHPGWVIGAVFLLIFAPVKARAVGFSCNPVNKTHHVSIVTTYTPSLGGMNGGCGKSASQWDTCQLYFKKHMNGGAPVVMAAVPQRGESAKLYGGIYMADIPRYNPKTKRVESMGPRFANIMIGDHFHRVYNDIPKIDIALETADPNDIEYISINRLTQFQEVPGSGLSGSPEFVPVNPTKEELQTGKATGLDLILCGTVPKYKNTFLKIMRQMKEIREYDEKFHKVKY